MHQHNPLSVEKKKEKERIKSRDLYMEELCRGARRKSGRRCHRRCRITTTAVSFKRGNDSNSITCTQHQREGVCNRQKNHKRKGMAGREKKRRVGGSPVTADLTSHVETPAVQYSTSPSSLVT